VLRTEIVKRRSDGVKGFVVLPRRWVVERTLSWFGGNRRLAKDFEHLAATFVILSPRSSLSSGDSPGRRRGVRKGVVKGSLPEPLGNGEEAPIPAVRGMATEPPSSTH
jgi:hypothetical protein